MYLNLARAADGKKKIKQQSVGDFTRFSFQ